MDGQWRRAENRQRRAAVSRTTTMQTTEKLELRILLLEPNRLWREGLSRVLEDTGYSVVAAAGPLSEALAELVRDGDAPDVVVLDASAIVDDPAGEFDAARGRFPETRIVVFTDPDAPGDALTCFLAGADGCLMKNISSKAMAGCLDLVALGERVFPASLIGALLKDPGMGGSPSPIPEVYRDLADPATAQLSKRERQILASLAVGRSNKQIAEENNLTEATIKVHLRNILRKIHANNRTQAAVWAITHKVSDTPAA
jgi:two-component system nitrate/nitrite response regulator NarL